MQIVINIKDSTYEAIKNEYCILPPQKGLLKILWDAIRNGTPLPKGHGRIADMDEAIKCIEEVEGEDAIWAISLIEWACGKRTLIEADRTESEDKE